MKKGIHVPCGRQHHACSIIATKGAKKTMGNVASHATWYLLKQFTLDIMRWGKRACSSEDANHCRDNECNRIHNEKERTERIMETDAICGGCGSIVEWFRPDCRFCDTKRVPKDRRKNKSTAGNRRLNRVEKAKAASYTPRKPIGPQPKRSRRKGRAWSTMPHCAV